MIQVIADAFGSAFPLAVLAIPLGCLVSWTVANIRASWNINSE